METGLLCEIKYIISFCTKERNLTIELLSTFTSLLLHYFGELLSDCDLGYFSYLLFTNVLILPVFDHCVLQLCITDDRAELSSIEWLPSIVWYIIAIEIVHATNVLDVPIYFGLVLTIGRESTMYYFYFSSCHLRLAFHISLNMDLTSYEKFLCNLSIYQEIPS